MSLNAQFIQGDTIALNITAKSIADNSSIDLTECSIKYALYNKASNPPQIVLEKTTSNGGIIITDAENGLFRVNISSEESEQLSGSYICEAQITDEGGHITTLRNEDLCPGKIEVYQEIIPND